MYSIQVSTNREAKIHTQQNKSLRLLLNLILRLHDSLLAAEAAATAARHLATAGDAAEQAQEEKDDDDCLEVHEIDDFVATNFDIEPPLAKLVLIIDLIFLFVPVPWQGTHQDVLNDELFRELGPEVHLESEEVEAL